MTTHQPLRVYSAIGMPFIVCSCDQSAHPQSSCWLESHWPGSEESGLRAIAEVVESQRRALAVPTPGEEPK